jgi:hypothetical protein
MKKEVKNLIEACMSKPLESINIVKEKTETTERIEIAFYFVIPKN